MSSSQKRNRDIKRENVMLKTKMKEIEEELEYFRGMFMEAHAREEVIKVIGHPAMKKKAPLVSTFGTDELKNVAMQVVSVAAMESALGFSAPQLGISSRVMAFDPNAEETKIKTAKELEEEMISGNEEEIKKESDFKVVVNPEWTALSDETTVEKEVCLSVPGFAADVRRFDRISLRGKDVNGESISMILQGWPARVVQHECDHLDGKNFTMTMEPGSLVSEEYAHEEELRKKEMGGDEIEVN
jgi:peptide deformylase